MNDVDAGHDHLWSLLDGTPAHAPAGRLTYDESERVACHLCGRWFRHLGGHIRHHQWSAAQYREAVGLPLNAPLCSPDLSSSISARQRRRWQNDPTLKVQLEAGQAMARTGELTRLSAQAARDRQVTPHQRALETQRRRASLAAGRSTQAKRRHQQINDLIAQSGAADLADLIERAYLRGSSLDALQKLTGLARAVLRQSLADSNVPIRPTGRNHVASKQRRAGDIDNAVAETLGVVDLHRWLSAQREAGVSMKELGRV